ncbi:F-box/FBD/LRR-repeat protein [Citrus sinensis]|nr:F-box/FBD/LRR-repeat protein At5g53840 [Citrus x clementina]KAH9651581.1 F-box/FBD/LRR-repeat protein [Citrus sinensis]
MENALRRNPKIPKFVVCSDIGGDCQGGDRLSNLPEPIIHHIFSFLETIDVVRASAVSRRWRYFWLSIPYLNFNIHNIWSNPLERWSLEKINEKFKDFVNWVLLSQNGSINIQRFLLSCFNCVDDYTLYRWLNAVAQRNVQVLDLDIISEEPIKLPRCLVTCESLMSLKLDFGNREHQGVLNLPTCAGFNQLKSLDLQHVEVLDYNLFRKFLSSCPLLENLYMKECFFRDFKILDIPSTSLKYLTIDEFLLSERKGLRSCEVICESLEALKLHFGLEIDKCVLKLPSTSVGFSRLKSLDLKHVELLDHSFFLKLISSSPFLENLIMDSCRFSDLRILDISSASLKSLTLDRIEFGGDEFGSYKLKIACPNLVSFNIFALLLPDITLEGLNSLQNTFVFLEDIGEHMEDIEICHRLSKILNGLCGVEVLKLSSTLYEILNASLEEGSYFSASFNNLKSLILCVTMAEWTVPLIIRLLNRSPNLEALTIYFDAGEYFDEWKISNKAILCLTCHLKTVDLVEFKGHENELELVRFLLKNGHVLQKLRISWLEDVYNRREIISRIMKFPRSSSSVILKFLQPKSPFDFCEILR